MDTIPTLETWLALPTPEIAQYVLPHRIAVMFTSDGTRRHYLLRHPEKNGQITNFLAYQQHTAALYAHSFTLLYELGVQAILTPGLYSLNFQRGSQMLQFFLDATQQSLLSEPLLSLYRIWDVQVRLYGDYDIAPAAEPIRDGLRSVEADLTALRPTGSRLLLFGYIADTFEVEYLQRGMALQTALNRLPTPDEIRLACFPHGPQRIHIHLGGGWMRVGRVLPFTLDDGATDLYFATGLTFDLTEENIRRILYDHLFLRHVAPEDNVAYTPEMIAALRSYYAGHGENVIGLGRLVGPGLWYPEM